MMRSAILAMAVVLTACVNEPVDWTDVSYRHSQLGDPPTRSAVMSAGLPSVAGTVAPCIRSIVSVSNRSEIFRAWWAVSADSNGVLSLRTDHQARNRS